MADKFFSNIKKAGEAVAKSLKKVKEVMKCRWDHGKWSTEEYEQGDLVMVTRSNLPTDWPSHKLDDKWRGPYQVVEKVGEAVWKLAMPEDWKGHPVFNKGWLKRHHPPAFPGQPLIPPPQPLLVNRHKEYEVESMVGEWKQEGWSQFLVHWKGYTMEDDVTDPFTFVSVMVSTPKS
jgi:hypothetical protein